MKAREPAKVGGMKGGIRRPRGPSGSWSYTLYLGQQAAQRCPACTEVKKRPNRWWIASERLTKCPNCGGELTERHEGRQITEGDFATKDDALQARSKAVVRLGMGHYVPPERMTLAEYLRDKWLPEVMASGLKQTTKEGYAHEVRDHLIGPAEKPHAIGLVELRKLNLEVIRSHYRDLMDSYFVEDYLRTKRSRRIMDKSTKKPKRGLVKRDGLSFASIKHVQAALHGALREAVELGMLDHNPATGAIRKKKLGQDEGDAAARELKAWTPDELQTFLGSQEGRPFYPLWRLVAVTGVRRGEALGLKWGDVDTDGARITVRCNRVPVKGGGIIETTTKTKRVRVVDIDRETVDVLKGMGRGLPAAHVFTDAGGQPLNPNSASYQFRLAVLATDLPLIGIHGLRHTHISELIADGQSVAMVAARAGHASSKMTLDVYSHALPGQQQSAVASMARYTRKGSVG